MDIIGWLEKNDYIGPAEHLPNRIAPLKRAYEHKRWLARLEKKLEAWYLVDPEINPEGQRWQESARKWRTKRHAKDRSRIFDHNDQPIIDQHKLPFPLLEGVPLKVMCALGVSELSTRKYLNIEAIRAIIRNHPWGGETSAEEIDIALEYLLEEYPITVIQIGANNTYRRILHTCSGWPCGSFIVRWLIEGENHVLASPSLYSDLKQVIGEKHYRASNAVPKAAVER